MSEFKLNDRTHWKEYTLDDLKARIRHEPQADRGFRHLPTASTMHIHSPWPEISDTASIQRIQVGSVIKDGRQYSGLSLTVFAYVDGKALSNRPTNVHFCFGNGRKTSPDYAMGVDLLYPFNKTVYPGSKRTKSIDSLRTLVLYYLLAKEFSKTIQLTNYHVQCFMDLCTSFTGVDGNTTRPQESGVGAPRQHIVRLKRCIVEDSEKDDETFSKSDEEHISKLNTCHLQAETLTTSRACKETQRDRWCELPVVAYTLEHRCADTPQFAEYQKLVQSIRKTTDTENDALKAENHALKTEIDHLKTQLAASGDLALSFKSQLERQDKEVGTARSQLEKKLQDTEAENQDLRTFKASIQACLRRE